MKLTSSEHAETRCRSATGWQPSAWPRAPPGLLPPTAPAPAGLGGVAGARGWGWGELGWRRAGGTCSHDPAHTSIITDHQKEDMTTVRMACSDSYHTNRCKNLDFILEAPHPKAAQGFLGETHVRGHTHEQPQDSLLCPAVLMPCWSRQLTDLGTDSWQSAHCTL